jgi:hypothetical protein
MKDLKAVNAEIKDILHTDTHGMKKYALNKMRKRLEFLELVKKYLESEPTQEFVAKEKARISHLVTTIVDGYGAWQAWNKDKGETYKEQRDYYEKEMELKKYKTQFKALDFILS